VKNIVEGRSIYVGDKEPFLNYIVDVKKEIGSKLRPIEQMERISQCIKWHKHVLKPCIERLQAAQRYQNMSTTYKNGSILFGE
jgi:hypothetical protein